MSNGESGIGRVGPDVPVKALIVGHFKVADHGSLTAFSIEAWTIGVGEEGVASGDKGGL